VGSAAGRRRAAPRTAVRRCTRLRTSSQPKGRKTHRLLFRAECRKALLAELTFGLLAFEISCCFRSLLVLGNPMGN